MHRTLLFITFLLGTLLCIEFFLRFTPIKDAHAPSFTAPRGYYTYNDKEGMTDIAPNVATTTHHTVEFSYDVWSNSQGCFDLPFAVGVKPYIYFTGDSFAWGYAPFEKKWGTILEDLLGFRVAKCGLASVGTAQELIKAEHTIASLGPPELIIVGYHGQSDPGDDLWFERHRGAGEKMPSRFVCDAAGQNLLLKARCFLDTHSLLYNEIEHVAVRADIPFISRQQRHSFFAPQFPFSEPVSEEEWAIHEKSFLGFKRLADTYDSKLLFVLIPSPIELASADASGSNAKAKEFLEKHHIPYLDLFPEFKSFTRETGVRFYRLQLAPFNEAGNEIAAALTAQFIAGQNFVPVSQNINERIEAQLFSLKKSGI